MKLFTVRKRHIAGMAALLVGCVCAQQPAFAQPFGAGIYGAPVSYGDLTSISIAVSGNPSIVTTLSGGIFSGSATHTVTVTSTDVVGYQLFVSGTSSTSMDNGAYSLAASSNTSAAPLATNSWGYNTTGSTTHFIGMTMSQVLLKNASGPFGSGDDTAVTYGAALDTNQASGTYSIGVTYTAAGES